MGDGKIAAFVELLGSETGPRAVDLAALGLTAKDEHDVGVTVIGAAGSVLASGAAKLTHSDEG